MSRKTISVDRHVFERLERHKRDGESWSATLERLVNASESQAGADDERTEALTPSHIDDIAGQTATRVVRELENSMTRR